MTMNKKELNEFFMSLSPTEEQKDKVLNELMKKELSTKRYSKKSVLMLAAAIILAITSLTAIASTFNWHEKLIEYFNPTEQQMEELQGMIDTPQATATDDGVTVNILQTIADNHGIYVLYEIEGSEDIAVDDTISWEYMNLKIKYANNSKVGTGGYAYNKILDYNNNKCTALYIRTGSSEISDQKLQFELSGLRKAEFNATKDKCTFTKLSDCNFNIEWDFKYENSGESFMVNREFNNGNNTLTQIDISPISLWITVAGEQLEPSTNIEVKLNNEEIIRFSLDTRSSYTPLYGGINTISYEFDQIINIDDIKSITVGNLIVPID